LIPATFAHILIPRARIRNTEERSNIAGMKVKRIKQGCGSGSGLDPDSVTLWIRIRIGNPDPDPGARKLRNFSGKMHKLFLKKIYQ
jgi:hypothetical protein